MDIRRLVQTYNYAVLNEQHILFRVISMHDHNNHRNYLWEREKKKEERYVMWVIFFII